MEEPDHWPSRDGYDVRLYKCFTSIDEIEEVTTFESAQWKEVYGVCKIPYLLIRLRL